MNQESVENYKNILNNENKRIDNYGSPIDIDKCIHFFDINEANMSLLKHTKNNIFNRKLPFTKFSILNNLPITIKYTAKEKIDLTPQQLEIMKEFTHFVGNIIVTELHYPDLDYLKKMNSELLWLQQSVRENTLNIKLTDENTKMLKELPILMDRLDINNLKVGQTLIQYFLKTYHNETLVDISSLTFCLETLKNISWNSTEKEVALFVCNFLDFLNHPKAERVEIEYTQKENDKRIMRGKLPYPSSVCMIRLDNVIKQYPNKESHTNREFSYKFWVRGHYIHFRNKTRYKYLYSLDFEKLNEKGYQLNGDIISKYINSFIKGKGKLYNKRYEVK